MSLHFSASDGSARLLEVTKDGKVLQWLRGARSTLPVKLAAPSNASNSGSLVSSSTTSENELVLGGSSGRLHIYNLIHGAQNDLSIDKSKISALHISQSRLLVGTIEGHLFEFARVGKDGTWAPAARLVKDELGQITAISSQEQWIYVAAKEGTRVKSIDSQTGAVVAKWPKCSAPPIASIVKAGGGLEEGLTVAFNDRQVIFHRSTKDSCALMGKSKPLHIEVNKFRGAKTNIVLAVVEENGTVALYSIPRKSNDTQLRPVSTVKVADDSMKIFAATFSDQNTLHIAYGNRSRPSFDIIKFVDASGNFEPKISVQPSSQALLPVSEDANTGSKDKKEKKQSNNNDSGKFAIVNPFDLKVPTLSQTKETNGASEEQAIAFGERLKSQVTVTAKGNQPKVESVDSALVQALKTKDLELLNKVFQTSNVVLIKKTVEKLPQSSVLPLLLFTVERFQTNPSMASQLTVWINAVLTIHLAYLMSVPSLPKALGPLYSVIEARLSVFQELLKLQGRLDLLVSQIDRRKNNASVLSAEPNAVYREEDEENDDSMEFEGDEDDDDMLGEDDEDGEGDEMDVDQDGSDDVGLPEDDDDDDMIDDEGSD